MKLKKEFKIQPSGSGKGYDNQAQKYSFSQLCLRLKYEWDY